MEGLDFLHNEKIVHRDVKGEKSWLATVFVLSEDHKKVQKRSVGLCRFVPTQEVGDAFAWVGLAPVQGAEVLQMTCPISQSITCEKGQILARTGGGSTSHPSTGVVVPDDSYAGLQTIFVQSHP